MATLPNRHSRAGGYLALRGHCNDQAHQAVLVLLENVRLNQAFGTNSLCFERLCVKWSGEFGQRAKVYPTLMNGYENDEATEFFKQV